MGYLKYMAYVYLIMAAVFAIDGVVRLNNGEDSLISFLFAGVAVFMFFFRKSSHKKYHNRQPKN
ncbi:hypothetical protein GR160_13395 [Flavobacterium sp. Sd200]|uniref:hypothetical protein n=1 Tax=Flavobacterium sp. Sd200 TaxID=2692211 RepID=UPI00136A1B52|nr:hypothetical protein [Flavobacterium sp. Sd200]MXN92218.1 hypothetical protein [Flavobacterium sp. Sd200]